MNAAELAQFDGPDDDTIVDPEPMWRRIQRFWIVADDATPGGSRLSRQAFAESKKPLGPCSLIRSSQSTPEHVQKRPENSVGAILPSVIRANGFKLVSAPVDDDPGHYNMVGVSDKATQLKLAESCTPVIGQPWGPGIPAPG